MKKFSSVFAVFSLVSVLVVPVSVFAQFSGNVGATGNVGVSANTGVGITGGSSNGSDAQIVALLQSQIAALLAQIQALKAQLATQSGGGSTQPPQFCYDFNSNLRIGDNGDAVTALQTILQKKENIGVSISGSYDEETASAVSAFQENHREILDKAGLRAGTGFAGPSTRAKLRALYGCNGANPPAIPPFFYSPPRKPLSTPGFPEQPAYQLPPSDPHITGSAVLVSASEDKTRLQFHQPDWKWQVSIVNNGSVNKVVKRMILVHNTGGEGWATDESVTNPVGKALYQLITDLPSNCQANCDLYYTDNLGVSIAPGQTLNFFAYGDPGSWRFTGGYLLIEFTDNTSAQIKIASSDITPGVGIVPVGVSEQVTCVFYGQGGTVTQSCRTADTNAFGCSGVGSCVAGVNGQTGAQLVWKSTCGGYAYTTIDGNNEKATFSCGDTVQSGAPVISGLSAPTYLNVGQSGTWTVKASDPNNGNLSYSVVWGDEFLTPAQGGMSMLAVPAPFVQNSTFNHSYATAGVYTPTFTVSNNSGLSAKTSASVQVGGNSTSPSITLNYPKGGEVIPFGKNLVVQWTPANLVGNVYIYLAFPDGGVCKLGSYPVNQGTNSFALSQGDQCSNISRTIQPGQYKIAIYADNGNPNNSDVGVARAYSGFFTLGSDTTLPSITVLAPSGGETWMKGMTQSIKWIDNSPSPTPICPIGAPCAIPGKFYDVKLAPYYPPCITAPCPAYPYREPYIITNGAGPDFYPWYVGKIVNTYGSGETAPDGLYAIQICQSGTNVCGSSKSYFTITSAAQPSVTVTSPNGGETIVKGATVHIKWNSTNVSTVYIKLRKGNDTYSGTEGYVSQQTINNTNYFDWTVPTTLPDGTDYAIRVLSADPSISGSAIVLDDSDSQFKIITPPTTQPSVTVTSPNGGESFALGSAIPVKWTQTMSSNATQVMVVNTNMATIYTSPTMTSAAGDNQWSLPASAITSPGSYRVNICSQVGTSGYCDPSNGYFSVILSGGAPTSTTTSTSAYSDSFSETASALDSIQQLLNQIKALLGTQ